MPRPISHADDGVVGAENSLLYKKDQIGRGLNKLTHYVTLFAAATDYLIPHIRDFAIFPNKA